MKKPTGGRLRERRKKRKREMGGDFVATKIGPRKLSQKRCMGGRIKLRLLSAEYANVNLPDGTSKKVRILEVLENPANREFVRTGTITKGAIIKTEIGKARVTSRPGQEPVINAVLIEETH